MSCNTKDPTSPCLICLQAFSNGDDSEKVPVSTLYQRFFKFLSKKFRLRSTSEKFLSCAKHVTNKNREQVPFKAFCNKCHQRVSKICDLFEQQEVLDMQLKWKLNELGSIMDTVSKSISRKLERRLLGTLAEHLHMNSAISVKVLRDVFRLKCKTYRIHAEPKVIVHHGLSPDEMKFPYTPTKQMLMRLITVYLLASYLNKVRDANNQNSLNTKICDKDRKRKWNSSSSEPVVNHLHDKTKSSCKKQKRSKEAVSDTVTEMKNVIQDDENVSESNSNVNMKEESSSDIWIKQEETDNESAVELENYTDDDHVDHDHEAGENEMIFNDKNPAIRTHLTDSCLEETVPPQSSTSPAVIKQSDKKWSLRKRKSSSLQYKESDEDEGGGNESGDVDWKYTSQRNKQVSSPDSEKGNTTRTYTRRKSLKPRKKRATLSEDQRECPHCPKVLDTIPKLKYHLKVAHGQSTPLRCDKSIKLDHETEEKHGETVPEMTNCRVCGFSKRVDILEQHLKTIHGGTYPCFTCEEKFETSKLLWTHLITHENENDKYISCNTCLRGFSTEQLRNLHNKFAHMNKTNFLCDHENCVEIFDSLAECNEHLKSHLVTVDVLEDGNEGRDENNKICTCSTCGIGFLDERRKTLHEILHTPKSSRGKGYNCPVCNVHQLNFQRFVLHYNNKHGVMFKSLRCKLCSQSFATSSHLGLHYKNKHGDSTEDMDIRNEWLRNHRQHLFEKQKGQSTTQAKQLISVLLDPSSPSPLSEEMDLVQKGIPGSESKARVTIPPCEADGCGEVLPSAYLLRKHLETKHENVEQVSKKFPCFHCYLWFAFEQSRDLHITTVHRRVANKIIQIGKMKRFICDDLNCQVSPFQTIIGLNNHLKRHLQEDVDKDDSCRNNPRQVLNCSKCNWGFLRKDYMQLHELIHVPPENDGFFVCPAVDCSDKFETPGTLRCHFSFVHVDPEKMVVCVLCTKRFYTNSNLIEHTIRHHTIKEIESSSLSEEIKSLDKMERRKRKRRQLEGSKGRKRYNCLNPDCRAFFDSPAALQYHQKKFHGRVLQFVCEECGESFYSRGHLASHMAKHRPTEHLCDICGKKLRRVQALVRHKLEVHNPNKQQNEVCKICGKELQTLTGLKYHMAAAHLPESDWKWKCVTCTRRFYRKDLRRAHMKVCQGEERKTHSAAAESLSTKVISN